MLMPILILAYISIVPYTHTLGDQIKASNFATAQEVSYLVEEHFKWSVKVGNYFVSTPMLVYSIEHNDRKGATERLTRLLASVPDIDRVYLATPKGILWVDYPPSPDIWGKNLSFRDWYKGVSKNWQPYVSEVYFRDIEPKRYVVSVAIPVKNGSNVIGIVVMQHRLETIQEWVAPVRLGKSGIIYIVDKNGIVVAHPKEDPKRPLNYSIIPIVRKVIKGIEGVEEVYDPVENNTMLSAYVPVKSIGMGVVAQQPAEEAFSPIRLHTNLSLILITLSGIFAVIVAREYDRNRNLYHTLTIQHTELKKRTEELSTLYEVDRVTSRTLDTNEVMTSALNKLVEVTCADSGDIYLMDEKSGELILKGQKGISLEALPLIERLKIGEGVAGTTVQQGDLIIINDIDKAPQSMTVYARKIGAKSLISVPIKVRGRIFGVLDLVSNTPRNFTIDEIELLKSIAIQIGIAVEKASLYEDLKTANLELENRLKELHKAYEELKTLDKMKDEFISNVSHELKTPLISIKGYGELLYDEKQGYLSDKQKKCLEAVIRNADRLTRLINSILFISRMQASRKFHFESVNLDEVIGICIDDFKSMMDRKQITFEKVIPKISAVKGEKDKIIEAINNLIDNAIKFTPVGGKILIKAWDDAENVHIIVSDNGIGIPKEIIPKLFMRFYQADASASRKYGGTGLGLYITKTIIDAFGGKIWIESEVADAGHRGTTVHVLLPAACS